MIIPVDDNAVDRDGFTLVRDRNITVVASGIMWVLDMDGLT